MDRENGGKDAQTFVYRDELWLEYQMEGMPLEFSQAINSKSSYTTKTDQLQVLLLIDSIYSLNNIVSGI